MNYELTQSMKAAEKCITRGISDDPSKRSGLEGQIVLYSSLAFTIINMKQTPRLYPT